MAEKPEPVAEALMSLLAGAAPLLDRARQSGLFRTAAAPAEAAPPPPAAMSGDAAQKAALQEIIVEQAIKIHALEAEIARLKA